MPFAYQTFAAATTALASRLQDSGLVYFSQPSQLLNNVVESVRLFQALTGSFKAKITFNTRPNVVYYPLGSVSPALADSATDVEVAQNVLAALLEPPLTGNGSGWVGTGQFTRSQLQTSLQNRLNRFIGDTGRHVVQQTVNGSDPPEPLVALPDAVTDVRRCAFTPVPVAIPSSSTGNILNSAGGAILTVNIGAPFSSDLAGAALALTPFLGGSPIVCHVQSVQSASQMTADVVVPSGTYYWVASPLVSYPLGRMDEWGNQAYDPGGSQTPQQPLTYSVYGTPPLQLRLDPPPANEYTLDLLTVQAGTTVNLNPQAPVALGIPDDVSAAIKWGVIADLCGTDGPSRDYARAAYAEQRYGEYVQLARIYPSVLTASISGASCGVGSVFDMDFYQPDWQQTSGQPSFVGMAGRHLACVGQTPDDGTAGGNPGNNYPVVLWSVANMPVPAAADPTGAATYIQVSRDQIDPVLDYAQHISSFQMGGSEFDGTARQYQNLITVAKAQNDRLDAVSFWRSRLEQNASRSNLETVRM